MHQKNGKLRRDDILPGEPHTFVFKRLGYKTKTVKWKFEPKQTRKEDVVLEKVNFSLKVESDPKDCSVYLDDKNVGKTPREITGLDPTKTYKLTLKHPSYKPWSSTIRFDEDQPVQKITKRMEPKGSGQIEIKHKAKTTIRKKPVHRAYGELSVNSTPWGKVFIDGKDTGKLTPLIKFRLSAGKHTITVKFNSGGQRTGVVEIKPGKATKRIFHR